MRLNEWRKTAPADEAMSPGVVGVLKPVLADFGAEPNPECWVAWGEEASLRYSILVPVSIGLISLAVRPSDPEGPRATARLIRWPKLVVSELSIEASGGHRLVAVQVESFVLKGVDDEADRICQFVAGLIGSIDGRSAQPLPIALVQSLAAGAAAVAAGTASAPAGAPAHAASSPRKSAPKPAAASVSRSAAKPAAKLSVVPAAPAAPAPAAGPAAAAVDTAPPGEAEPAAPATPARPKRITPLAAGVAAAQNRSRTAAQPNKPAEPQEEPEPDRTGWVRPHPIEPSHTRTPKPPQRPWMP